MRPFFLYFFLSLCWASVSEEMKAARSISDLSWKLIESSGNKNSISSPTSIWMGLAMTHAGAKGETAAQISKVLGFPNERMAIANEAFSIKNILDKASNEAIKLSMANRVFVQRGKEALPDFVSLLTQKFDSPLETLELVQEPEKSRMKINQWVSEKTEQKIPELLKEGSIDSLTRMVLTNAIYFKAPWALRFDKNETQPTPFFISEKKSVSVPFMKNNGKYLAGEMGIGERAATVCEVPYLSTANKSQLAMLLIVPKKVRGLNAVLKSLRDYTPERILRESNPQNRETTLSLPKWTSRTPLDLRPFLKSLGMTAAFKPGSADFSGIDGVKDLYLSKAIHEGFVEVSEEGTEAAAASAVVMSVRGMPSAPKVIKVDRPFLWMIYEKASGLMIFSGKVVNPQAN